MTDVSVIVLDLDGGDMLRACLHSIAAQSVPPVEVIVFDNGSREPSQAPGARIIRSETNIGFAGGVNEAYRRARGELIALVNNDVVLDRDWLEIVTGSMRDDPAIGAVQTIIRRDESTIDGAGIDISDGTFRQLGHGEPFAVRRSSFADAWGVSATAALYRRSAIGDRFFDPRFFAYYEDVELCARLHDGGWKTEVLPVIKATHAGSRSAALLGGGALRLRTRNRYWVARRHRGVGRIGALLAEDARLLLRGRSSLRGMMQGLVGRMKAEG